MQMSTEHWWIDTDRGKRNTGRETCHRDTLCNTNLTRNNLGSNLGPVQFHAGDLPPEPKARLRLRLQTPAVAVSCYRAGQVFLRLGVLSAG